LSSSTQTPEAKALSEEYNKTRDEMNKLKAQNEEAYNKRGELRGQREELQKERDRAYEGKKKVQDEYYKQRDAYRAWNEQARKVRSSTKSLDHISRPYPSTMSSYLSSWFPTDDSRCFIFVFLLFCGLD
jgi:chromosome segregation ATPase